MEDCTSRSLLTSILDTDSVGQYKTGGKFLRDIIAN